ncbi:MAG: molybdopterin-dependent oxidoreductase [bacterium]|nr:molybdopterin-dependent oxidoreductase [candidate division KSB1 bacterium]MDH7558729.1 molybdopterin-dependent oxidoreductase [bacterium]
MSKVLTTCPFCGCGCGVLLAVEGERVLGVAPQRRHPVSRGTLCVKGWNGHQIIHHPGRLRRPLIKKNGKFQEASWEAAIALVAKTLKSFDPTGIGVVGSTKCTNEDSYLLMKLARGVLGTDNVDTGARFYQAPTLHALSAQLGFAAATASLTDIEEADVLLVVGANPKEQSAKAGSYVLWAARHGAKVVVVDPRETELSHFATLHLRPKPGSDVVWLNALCNWLIRSNRQVAEARGVNALAKALESFTPDSAAQLSGIPSEQLARLGETVSGAQRLLVLYGNGVTQQASGTEAVKALVNLLVLTGNIGRPGAGLLPLHPANNMQGVLDMGLAPGFLPGFARLEDREAASCLGKVLPSALPKKPGLTLGEMLQAAGDQIKAMYVVGENLVWDAPNSGAAKAALERLDFLVVQDLFLTETAELAHVVLPACSYAEKEGTFTNLERRIQRVRAAIPPVGEAKPDWEIFLTLAKKLAARMAYRSPADVFAEIATVNPWYQGISYQDLNRPGGVQWPVARPLPSLADAKLLAARYVPPSEFPDQNYPFTLVIGRGRVHRVSGTLVSRSFTLAKEYPEGVLEVNTDDAKELGLRSGWKARVTTPRGTIERTVQVTRGVPPKVVFASLHYKDGLTNVLANDKLEQQSKIPEMKVCAARVEVA